MSSQPTELGLKVPSPLWGQPSPPGTCGSSEQIYQRLSWPMMGDKAGRLATAKALEVLEEQEVEVVQFPDQMDPDEYLNKNSPQALAVYWKKHVSVA